MYVYVYYRINSLDSKTFGISAEIDRSVDHVGKKKRQAENIFLEDEAAASI